MIQSHHFLATLRVLPVCQAWTEGDFLNVLKEAVYRAGMTPVNESAFGFDPHGVSAVILLAESHVALHFWAEEGKVTLDIHVCDYQNLNYQKAVLLAKLLTEQLTGVSSFEAWQYVSITG